jgi:predicted peptidase
MIQNDQWPNDRPFVVLSPQYGGAQCPGAMDVETFLGWAIDAYDIDSSRVYLAAISCGAFGGWNYLGQVADTQITATVLIAGNGAGPFNQAGCDLARAPIWAFHGDADQTVPVEGTTGPINGLLMCNPTPDVQMTIYPGVGHDSWTRTFDGSAGHDVFGWFLSYP